VACRLAYAPERVEAVVPYKALVDLISDARSIGDGAKGRNATVEYISMTGSH